MPHALTQQLHVAVLGLCTDAPLELRLAEAYDRLRDVDASSVPEAIHARFAELIADLTYGADTVPQALAAMSSADRVVLAARVVSLYGEAARLAGPEG